ncbi:MAG: TadE/TadG family type IV pilus assembly protein [Burkholderiaceae bacterium]
MKSRQQGVALIELALILPLLVMLTFLTTEFGRALYQYNTLVKAARDGVRYLSIQTPSTHVAEAKNLVVYGSPAPATGATPLLPGLTTDNVSLTWQLAGSDPLMNTVTVKISNYVFRPIASSVFGLALDTIPFNDISATMRSPT